MDGNIGSTCVKVTELILGETCNLKMKAPSCISFCPLSSEKIMTSHKDV